MILETIITSINADNSVHIAPMGIREEGEMLVIAPFRPSTTLDNLLRSGRAIVNLTDDVRVFAGCLTGRHDWPTRPAESGHGSVLQGALAHLEVEVAHREDDELRPRFHCRTRVQKTHRPFRGFNRAQAAVLEAAILVSRLDMLAASKVDQELSYLQIAIDKTAGEPERQAWSWLQERIQQHRQGTARAES